MVNVSNSTGDAKFYDKVAKKFGGYTTNVSYITEYPTKQPEEVFKSKILQLVDKDSLVLDVGCADGRFTVSLAPNFKKIVAIDLSDGMLEAAKKNQAGQGIENVSFEKQNASNITYPDSTFDLIYSRRGPTFYQEFYRLLKPRGYYVEIQIGENDAKDLKQTFDRGQDYRGWDNPKLERNSKELEEAGFKIVFAQDYAYSESYASPEDLSIFLEGVPIFEDFDPEKDKKYLEQYINSHTTKKGILLPRHRVVIVAEK